MLRHGLICKDKDINEDRRTRKAGTIQCTCINLNPGYVHKSGSEVGVISTWMLSLRGTPPPPFISFKLYTLPSIWVFHQCRSPPKYGTRCGTNDVLAYILLYSPRTIDSTVTSFLYWHIKNFNQGIEEGRIPDDALLQKQYLEFDKRTR